MKRLMAVRVREKDLGWLWPLWRTQPSKIFGIARASVRAASDIPEIS
jgi:hypothetical protein